MYAALSQAALGGLMRGLTFLRAMRLWRMKGLEEAESRSRGVVITRGKDGRPGSGTEKMWVKIGRSRS